MPRAPLVRRLAVAPLAASLALGALVGCGAARANVRAAAELADLSLEQLANVVVTSAARREQPLTQAAASVFVITGDDIRRSGARTLPEALRLAPNLIVARTDANNYAISARGFSNILANRLLVTIDGRTVFSPLFSGVFWDAEDVMLEDVDRIEVIDGPAATLWGTNAVHGVINVVTRSAHATRGRLLAAGGGNREWAAAARSGGTTDGGSAWRMFARGYGTDASTFANGAAVGDESERVHAGFRIDSPDGVSRWTLQGDLYAADVDQGGVTRALTGGNMLARWHHALDDATALVLQAYYDRRERDHASAFQATLDTIDVEGQASLRPRPDHVLLVGAGLRYQRDSVRNSPLQAFLPPERDLTTLYAVVQDEVALADDVALVAGVKAERNAYTGTEWLPSLRLRWTATPATTVWSAASRAVRAPARIDRDLHLPGAPPYAIAGQSTFDAEVTNVFEAGARGHVGTRASWSLTAYYHDHDRLRSLEPSGTGALQFGNGIEGSTKGVEGWATWQAADHWRLSIGGMELRQRLRAKPGVTDVGGVAALGNDPRRQYMLRSALDLVQNVEIDLIARYVGARPNPHVSDYATVDATIGWRVTRDLDLALTLTNLGNDSHPEWGPAANPAEYGRAWFLKLTARL